MRGLPMILTGLSVLSVAVPTVAQQAGEAVIVVAGPQYEAGGFHRFLFGSGYRDLWTMPIEVPVLDLENEAGGLEPLMVVGNLQTLGLALRGANGKSYTFRGVHKDLARVLPEELRDTAIADMVQDMIADPTLDAFFDRNPATMTDDDFRAFIEIERVRRAEFITAESSK